MLCRDAYHGNWKNSIRLLFMSPLLQGIKCASIEIASSFTAVLWCDFPLAQMSPPYHTSFSESSLSFATSMTAHLVIGDAQNHSLPMFLLLRAAFTFTSCGLPSLFAACQPLMIRVLSHPLSPFLSLCDFKMYLPCQPCSRRSEIKSDLLLPPLLSEQTAGQERQVEV